MCHIPAQSDSAIQTTSNVQVSWTGTDGKLYAHHTVGKKEVGWKAQLATGCGMV
jgi:hypothetical protein